jgi:hypothetical protein
VAIASLEDFRAQVASPHQRLMRLKVFPGGANSIQGPISAWLNGGFPGLAPGAGGVCTKATLGALANFPSPASGMLRLLSRAVSPEFSGTGGLGAHHVVLYDRLVHMSGLSGVVTGAQTTNLPTAPLTRYTSGVGVRAFLEIYTQLGTTGANGRLSYTNQDGTSGRTSGDFFLAGAQAPNRGRAAGTLVAVNLAAGDTGVRSVESVTIDTTTGTVGNFGVTLAYPLAIIASRAYNARQRDLPMFGCGDAVRIEDDACLWPVCNLQSGLAAGSGAIGIGLGLYRSST